MAKAVVPSSIVFGVLEKDNYEDWSETIQSYLEFKDLWDVVESNEQPPYRDAAWKKKNSEALHAIQISCGSHFFSMIRGIREANKSWRTLQAYFNPPLPEYTINPQQGDEENVDDEYQKAFKPLADALSKRDISDAIESCKNNLTLLKERPPTPLLHQLMMLVSDELDDFPKEPSEMKDELYSITRSDVWTLEDGKYGATLITKCFDEEKFDFASKFLKEHSHLIFAKDVNGLSPLHAAARAPRLFDSHISPYKFETFRYLNGTIFSVIPQVVLELRERLWGLRLSEVTVRLIAIRNAIRDSQLTSDRLHGALFEAIKCGNFNFIVMLINYDKIFLEEVKDMSKNIYTCAIEYRQPKVFSLIFWDKKTRKERRNYANVLQDKWKNNLLHMAATWTTPNAPDRISKPTLQMTTETMWFEEVSVLAPDLMKLVNIDGKTPYELFKESHKDLMMKAEKGMKESVASWGIVGPLVITIMFAAAFQIPGGYNQEMGFPIFLNKTWFTLYLVLVSISLFAATNSVAKILEIRSSDHHEKDFLISLTTYMRTYDLITSYLILSLMTMVLAFCFGLFVTLHGELAIFLPIAVAATIFLSHIASKNLALLCESVGFKERENPLFEKNIGDEVERLLKKLNQTDR